MRGWAGTVLLVALIASANAQIENKGLGEAIRAIEDQRLEEARTMIDRLAGQRPSDERVRILDGMLLVYQGEIGRAAERFEELRKEYPESSEVYNNLAVVYATLGRLEDALGTLREGVLKAPSAMMYLNLAEVHTKLAARAAQQANELGMDPPPAPGTVEEERDLEAVSSNEDNGSKRQEAPTVPRRNEQGADETHTVRAGNEEQIVQKPSVWCVESERLGRGHEALEAEKWLRGEDASEVTTHRFKAERKTSYIVYLDTGNDAGQAREIMNKAKEWGIKDIARIPRGGLSNAVSFGVYNQHDIAKRRQGHIEKAGFESEIKIKKWIGAPGAYTVRARTGDAMIATRWKVGGNPGNLAVEECEG